MRSVLFTLVLCAAPAMAQVCVTGVVERASGPTVCMQRFTHRLACTDVYLVSSSATVNLDRYVGQNVRITGREVGVTCAVLDVGRIDPPTAVLTWCGSGSTGCPLKFVVCPVGMGRYWMFLGFARDYRPLGCGTSGWLDGTILIRDPLIPIAAGGAGSCGELVLQVPFDNALVGVDLVFQGARQDIGPVGPLQLTNAGCVRLAPFMPPCAPTGC